MVVNVSVLDSTTLETDDGEILLDYSKNLINQEVMSMLLAMVTYAPPCRGFYFERALCICCL